MQRQSHPAIDALLEDADASLDVEPFSVTDKQVVPPSNNPNDYMSLGPYWWPNPETADGLPYVRHDGQVNPEIENFDLMRIHQLHTHVPNLALAWHLTGRQEYAQHAANLMRTFFLDPAKGMNPHLQYGQAIPGKCTGRGIGIIETESLPYVLDMLLLIRNSDAWTDHDHDRLRDWFSDYLIWLRESQYGKDEEVHPNNHGTAWDLQAIRYAIFTGQQQIARDIAARVSDRRIDKHIESDGRQPRELARTISLNYTTKNLGLLLSIAACARQLEILLLEYESSDGRSIRKALDWLVPFYRCQQDWQHEQIKLFELEEAYELLRQAAWLFNEPTYAETADQLPDPPSEVFKGFPPEQRERHIANLLY